MATHDKARVFQPPADGWFQIAPKGETLHRESGLMQVVDDASIQSMVSRFKAEAAQPGFAGKLVDFDHYSDLTDAERATLQSVSVQLPSKAAGWIKDAEARADGAYIKIDLTPDGQQALANGDYRFLSPVFRMADVEDLGNNRVRPLAFKKAGLTNEPRMKSIAALTNADAGERVLVGSMVELKNSAPADANAGLDNSAQSMKQINLALKLKEDAPESEAVAAITSLMNRAEAADKAALKAKVDGALTKYAGVIANREQAEAALTANYDATVAAFDLVKPAAGKSSTLPNREGAALPVESATAAVTQMQQQEALITEIKNRDKCSGEEAFARARVAKPELFAAPKE